MHIAVMGAGAVGGYFGARLAAAGHDISFVARGRDLAAIRAAGLVVKSANGDVVARQMRFADTLPHGMRSSMLNDLVAGNRLEAPWLCGAVERMAKPLRIATPINNAIHAALAPYGDGRQVGQAEETA